MSAEGLPGDQEITALLLAWRQGDAVALERLVPLVYHELHRMARNEMGRERRDHTLQPTALVNEVYLRLVNLKSVSWNDRAHFFALTARLMRRILVDLARAKGYQKRGGGAPKASLDEAAAVPTMQPEDLVSLDEAMQRLAAMDPRRSEVVELRFFGGLEIEEIAEVLKVSRHTVMRDWALARTWLFRELQREPPADD